MADKDPVTRVSQALCLADGHDPEEHIYVSSEVIEIAGAHHCREVRAPAWTSYVGKAGRLVAATVALELAKERIGQKDKKNASTNACYLSSWRL